MAGSQETAAQSLASISQTPATASDPLLNPTTSINKRLRSPEPVSLRKSVSPGSALRATGISEMTEAKRRKTGKESITQTSKNPAIEALNALSGLHAISKASDAPMSLATAAITPSVSAPETGTSSAQTSPTTVGSTEGLPINPPQVASPGTMDRDDGEGDAGSNKAYSYPPPLVNAQLDGKRGMSLPGSASRDAKSPATNKKHKCPYCETEFTRHHNLKSHLLTHSHEKPYMCQTCDSRFRRLHDLKRHTKLHTGERPHTCPKCNRKFARGDALARHAKGPGGCAGRRSSVGDYGGDDDTMEGMVYTDGQSHEPDGIEDDEATGSSVPSIRHHAPVLPPHRAETSPAFNNRVGSTYPPIAARAHMGSLHPPGHPSSASSAPQFAAPYPPSGVFPTSQMTESPKPLSPGGMHPDDARRGSYGRRIRNTPPPSLPPANQLPSLPGLAPPDSRYVLHSTPGGSGPSPTLPHPSSGTFPPHSASNSLSSHGTGVHGSGERGHMPFAAEDRLWAVIKSLEAKVERLEDEVRMLRAHQTSPTQTISSSGTNLPPPGGR